MSLIYIDSSFLLAIILGEEKAEQHAQIWNEAVTRLSSILLQVECSVVLHRIEAAAAAWRSFEGLLRGANLRLADERIATRIGGDASYGRLRSLDALHFATACEARDETGGEVEVACLDRRFRETAVSFGLGLLPEKLSEEDQVG